MYKIPICMYVLKWRSMFESKIAPGIIENLN